MNTRAPTPAVKTAPISRRLATLAVCCLLTLAAHAADTEKPLRLQPPADPAAATEAQWTAFRDNLARALRSDHEGLHVGALRMIIQYGDYLHFDRRTVFAVVRLYRNHRNERMRRMAVVALGAMRDGWGYDLLRRSVPYEKAPALRQTILAVLAQHRAEAPIPAELARVERTN